YWVMISSTLLALAGIALAYLMYRRPVISPEALVQRLPRTYRLLSRKYYIDEIYQFLIDRLVDGSARVLYWVDLHLVDGAVNGVGGSTRRGGFWLQRLQSGQAQHYALALVSAVIIMALVFGLLELPAAEAAGGGVLTWLCR
ncbi:MAG: NADH-quinone oxidoreductase subunit L, partial [Syntrophomonadaceae bacterium]|nr:NADH-quinone oxidoreductase subunit L [Syntrophomonadaceae bacterium]